MAVYTTHFLLGQRSLRKAMWMKLRTLHPTKVRLKVSVPPRAVFWVVPLTKAPHTANGYASISIVSNKATTAITTTIPNGYGDHGTALTHDRREGCCRRASPQTQVANNLSRLGNIEAGFVDRVKV